MGLVPYNNATIPLFCTTPIIYQDVNNPSKYMCGIQMFSYLRIIEFVSLTKPEETVRCRIFQYQTVPQNEDTHKNQNRIC